MLQERRLALEREMGAAKTGMESEKTAVDSNILENLQHQLEIATKVTSCLMNYCMLKFGNKVHAWDASLCLVLRSSRKL